MPCSRLLRSRREPGRCSAFRPTDRRTIGQTRIASAYASIGERNAHIGNEILRSDLVGHGEIEIERPRCHPIAGTLHQCAFLDARIEQYVRIGELEVRSDDASDQTVALGQVVGDERRARGCSRRDRNEDLEVVASFFADPEMLASLAVDLADHYKKTHGRGDEILKALEARRADVEAKLANFVKAISQGIFNDTTAEAMHSLEEQKRELDAAIRAEHVKTTLYEDEASIGAFYKRFAEATIDTAETRDQLFEYFVDKVFIGREQIIIASYYHDSAGPIEFEDLRRVNTQNVT